MDFNFNYIKQNYKFLSEDFDFNQLDDESTDQNITAVSQMMYGNQIDIKKLLEIRYNIKLPAFVQDTSINEFWYSKLYHKTAKWGNIERYIKTLTTNGWTNLIPNNISRYMINDRFGLNLTCLPTPQKNILLDHNTVFKSLEQFPFIVEKLQNYKFQDPSEDNSLFIDRMLVSPDNALMAMVTAYRSDDGRYQYQIFFILTFNQEDVSLQELINNIKTKAKKENKNETLNTIKLFKQICKSNSYKITIPNNIFTYVNIAGHDALRYSISKGKKEPMAFVWNKDLFHPQIEKMINSSAWERMYPQPDPGAHIEVPKYVWEDIYSHGDVKDITIRGAGAIGTHVYEYVPMDLIFYEFIDTKNDLYTVTLLLTNDYKHDINGKVIPIKLKRIGQ